MLSYPLRYDIVFKICRTIQNSMDGSKYYLLGINLDLIFHFVFPFLIYAILVKFLKPRKIFVIILCIILLKELNDFYIFYYYMDIQLKFVLSGLRDILISISGLLMIHYFIGWIKRRFGTKKNVGGKLKILHTMTWLAPGGGADTNVYLTIKELADEFEMHLATGGEIHHNPFTEIEGVKIYVCNDLIRPISLWKDFKSLLYFIKLIRKEKYDIVHTHEAKAGLITRLAAFFGGCQYIIYGLHGVTFNDPMSRLRYNVLVMVEKFTVWMVDLIVSVSQDCIDEYHKKKIALKIPVKLIYSGIDINRFVNPPSSTTLQELKEQLGIGSCDKILINIGRFSISKNQIQTLQALKDVIIEHPDTKCIFVGEGAELDNCKDYVNKHGMQKNVVFRGFTREIGELLHLADLLVITSLREGLPRVVVEASLCKVATVGFEVEGIREVLTDEESGFVVPSGDVKKLTSRIIDMLDNEDLRSKFAQKSFEYTKSRWDHHFMVDELRQIYNSSSEQ